MRGLRPQWSYSEAEKRLLLVKETQRAKLGRAILLPSSRECWLCGCFSTCQSHEYLPLASVSILYCSHVRDCWCSLLAIWVGSLLEGLLYKGAGFFYWGPKIRDHTLENYCHFLLALRPIGMFGTRLNGRDVHASARYIHTKLTTLLGRQGVKKEVDEFEFNQVLSTCSTMRLPEASCARVFGVC